MRGRSVEGVLILDKPIGSTSNAVLQRTKRLFSARKAGHSGSLDPIASGVLPILFGQTARLSRFLLNADKSYECTAVFGSNTTTGDTEGEHLYCCDTDSLSATQVEKALPQLRDSIIQYPPLFSAVKVKGQPLYRSARKGVHVDRPARRVHIYEAILQKFIPGKIARAHIKITCSKGTYIRSWVADLGRILGCGAYVSQLRRIQAGSFTIDQTTDIETIENMAHRNQYDQLDALLLPAQDLVQHLPQLKVQPSEARCLRNGQSISATVSADSLVRIVVDTGEFVGIGQYSEPKGLQPCIMFNVHS